MGEAYRAKDTRLGRGVAVEVLPRSVAWDPETLTRFERETRAIDASLTAGALLVDRLRTERDDEGGKPPDGRGLTGA